MLSGVCGSKASIETAASGAGAERSARVGRPDPTPRVRARPLEDRFTRVPKFGLDRCRAGSKSPRSGMLETDPRFSRSDSTSRARSRRGPCC